MFEYKARLKRNPHKQIYLIEMDGRCFLTWLQDFYFVSWLGIRPPLP